MRRRSNIYRVEGGFDTNYNGRDRLRLDFLLKEMFHLRVVERERMLGDSAVEIRYKRGKETVLQNSTLLYFPVHAYTRTGVLLIIV